MDAGIVDLAAVEALLASGTPEGLHLEYKRKQDPATPQLSKEDKRAVAEAVAAFANSDGGALVYGVGSGKRDGLDVAVALVPIADVTAFAAQLRLVVELNVSPHVPGVEVHAIHAADASGRGFAVVRVPRSDARPHMSTAPGVHRYYRRGFTGSEIMTPSEIRDQILATREAILEPVVTIQAGGSLHGRPDWMGLQIGISVKLRNVGARLCRDPFLRVSASSRLMSHAFAFDGRLGAWKSDYPPGLLIHVDDDGPAESFRFLARLDKGPLRRPDELDVATLVRSLTIHPGGDPHDVASFAVPALDRIGLRVTFGAENATARSTSHTFERDEIARSVLANLAQSLADQLGFDLPRWRFDVFEELRRGELSR